MTNSYHLNSETIQGFFDADGSFEAKVYLGTEKPISFHVNVIFSQKDKDVLQSILDSTGAINTKGSTLKKVSERQIENQSGTISIGNSISMAFSRIGAKQLLQFWQVNPPKAPTKFLDYRIACILSEGSTSTALEVLKKYLPNNTVSNSEHMAGLSLLWLRFRMYGKVKDSKNPNLIPIEEYYAKMNATQLEIDQSVVIGQQLYALIKHDMDSCGSKLSISEDYLVGYHIGDGCFSIETQFGSNGSSFKANFFWSVTDCKDNYALLEAIKAKLEVDGINCNNIYDYKTYCKLSVTSIESCKQLVEKWKSKKLTKVRQNQYDCFAKALDMYCSADFREDLDKLEAFIRLKWVMNPGTNYKKKGSLNDDLVKVKTYFNNKS
jgi:hypothetical protein